MEVLILGKQFNIQCKNYFDRVGVTWYPGRDADLIRNRNSYSIEQSLDMSVLLQTR